MDSDPAAAEKLVSIKWGVKCEVIRVVLDATVLVAGTTGSSDFPVSEDCYDSQLGGRVDIFLLHMYLAMPPSEPLNILLEQGDGWLNLFCP